MSQELHKWVSYLSAICTRHKRSVNSGAQVEFVKANILIKTILHFEFSF